MGDRSETTSAARRLKKRQLRRNRAGAPDERCSNGRLPSSRTLEAPAAQRAREMTEANGRLGMAKLKCQGLDGGLPENEKLFLSIFEHANAGMNILTLDGCFLQVNPAFCSFIGYSREELRERSVFDLTHPEDLEATRKMFDQIETGSCRAFEYEKRFVRKDDKVVWGHVTSAWLFDVQNRPLYGIGLVQDTSARKKAEAGLLRALTQSREAHDKINGILRSVGEGLIVTDHRQRVVLMSPSAEELLGIASRQVVNQPVERVFAETALPEALRMALSGQGGGDLYEFELPGGGEKPKRTIQARLSEIRDRSGGRSGLITILHDITRESEIQRMKTEFVTTAAHELRTPLTSIQGFSEVLLERSDLKPGDQRAILSIIHEQAETLSNVVTELLDLARIESGRGIILNKTSCDLSVLIRQAVSHVPRKEDLHRIETLLPAGAEAVYGDPVKLLQVLENILSNAVKYSPRGGAIRIVGMRSPGEIRLSVADQGIGMNEEQVQRIFDKFYRADTSNSAVEGAGLGMSIVKEIVEAHGGRVWVESAPGRGTRVSFVLPQEG
jgi:PAS domain S-box-containing protein